MNGTALSTMAQHEQDQADDSPALRKFREAMGASRFSRLMATYVLADELDANLCEEEETLRRFAKAAGTSTEAMQADLRWARVIAEQDLRGAFAADAVPDLEWSERISLEHLRTIARAVHPDGLALSSGERARWLVSSYHADETSAEFKDTLRKAGLLRARQPKAIPAAEEERLIMDARGMIAQLVDLASGDRGANVAKKVRGSIHRRLKVLDQAPPETPTDLSAFLRFMANALDAAGEQTPLPCALKPGTYDLVKTMRRVADLLPAGATFTLGTVEGGKADDATARQHHLWGQRAGAARLPG